MSKRIAETLYCDGFEDALVALVHTDKDMPPLALYNYDACLKVLQERDGMDEAEALEFFDFNVLGAWMGDGTPMFVATQEFMLDDLDDIDIDESDVFLKGYEVAVMGAAVRFGMDDMHVIYDYDQCVNLVMARNQLGLEGAMAWFDKNVMQPSRESETYPIFASTSDLRVELDRQAAEERVETAPAI